MRIGVISDSHGRVNKIEQALLKMGSIDALLHAGDHGSGFQEIEFPIPLYIVLGNSDTDIGVPEDLIIQLGGKNIFLTHGHKYNVDSKLIKLERQAEIAHAKIVVFGHTHVPFNEIRNGILFLNPGSVSRPRGGSKASCAVINIDEGEITAEIFSL